MTSHFSNKVFIPLFSFPNNDYGENNGQIYIYMKNQIRINIFKYIININKHRKYIL